MTLFDEPSSEEHRHPRPPPAGRRERHRSAAMRQVRRRLLRRHRHAARRPPPFDAVSSRDQVQRHAPPGSRRLRLRAPRRRHRVRRTPTAGRATTSRRPLRRRRTTISTSTTSGSPSRTRTTGTASATPTTRAAAGLPLQSRRRSTSSADCFTDADPCVTRRLQHRHARAVAVVDDDAAAGRPGRRDHPDPRRLPGEPLPQGAGRQPEPHAAGDACPEFRQRYAVLRARWRTRLPELRASDAARWCASTTTAGRCARSPADLQATKYIGQSMLLAGARPLPRAERRQLLPQRAASTRLSGPPASTGPATASCRRWATTCWAARSRSSAARSRSARPGSSRWSSAPNTSSCSTSSPSIVRAQRRPHVRAHRPGRFRAALLIKIADARMAP